MNGGKRRRIIRCILYTMVNCDFLDLFDDFCFMLFNNFCGIERFYLNRIVTRHTTEYNTTQTGH